jgi:hypothetical protein
MSDSFIGRSSNQLPLAIVSSALCADGVRAVLLVQEGFGRLVRQS